MNDGEEPACETRRHHDPREVLLAEVAAAREQLRALVEKMKDERLEWERRLLELHRSPRLTVEQKKRLGHRPPRSE
jgi:hypothetical protein